MHNLRAILFASESPTERLPGATNRFHIRENGFDLQLAALPKARGEAKFTVRRLVVNIEARRVADMVVKRAAATSGQSDSDIAPQSGAADEKGMCAHGTLQLTHREVRVDVVLWALVSIGSRC